MSKADDKFLEAKAPHTRGFDVRPGSLDREAGTVEVIASTGARVRRSGWLDEYEEELVISDTVVDLTRFVTVGPVLNNHSAWGSVLNVLGVVERAWIEDRKLIAKLRFDMADPVAAEVFGKIERGILRAVSLGYEAEYERIRAKDRDDGGDVDLYRSTRLEPYEVSVVMMPADAAATFRSADESRKKYPITTRTREPEESTMSERQTETQPSTAPTQAPDSRETLKAGLERVASVRQQLRALALDEAQAEALVLAHDDDLKLRSAMLTMVEQRQKDTGADKINPTHTTMGATADEKRYAVMVAGLSMRLFGELPKSRKLRGVKADDVEVERYRSLSMMDVALECFEAKGGSERQLRSLAQNERAKVLMGMPLATRAAGMNTVSDFSIIANTLVNVTLAQRYQARPSEWKRIARKVNAPNFKPISSIASGVFPPFLEVPEAGTYQRGSTTERDYTIRLKKAGRIFTWSWELMLADDFNLLAGVINDAANRARQYEDSIFRAKLAANKLYDGVTDFFSVGNANIAAATGVPSAATLKSALKAMAKQRGESLPAGEDAAQQDYMVLRPSFALLGSDDITDMEQLLGGGYVPTGSTGAVTPRMRTLANGLIEEPTLDDQSPVFFALFSDPNELAAGQWGHLDGEDGPVFEQQEGFTSDGIDYKARNAFYFEWVEPKAAVKVNRS